MPDISYFESQVEQLQSILDAHRDKRVCVVGATCTGKSYFVEHLRGAQDMDELVFPLLSKEESEYVCQNPGTPEIGNYMIRLVRERVRIEPGKPVFGTVVIESDLLIHLHISEQLLRERTTSRRVSYEDAVNMQKQIESEVQSSGTYTMRFFVG